MFPDLKHNLLLTIGYTGADKTQNVYCSLLSTVLSVEMRAAPFCIAVSVRGQENSPSVLFLGLS